MAKTIVSRQDAMTPRNNVQLWVEDLFSSPLCLRILAVHFDVVVLVGGIVSFLFLVCSPVSAEQKTIRGKVTYVASGTVYTSLGRESGARDSTLLYVTTNTDTIATLKVFAVSSKSSACVVVRSFRQITIGDDVVGQVVAEEQKADSVATTVLPKGIESVSAAVKPKPPADTNLFDLQGRVSAQYFTALYDNNIYNIAQPGIVLNLRGTARDVPLKLDMYANLRTLSIGGGSPFAKSGINQSRIYGLSLSYDDGENVATIGRIIPTFAPSLGYIDGGVLSRKFGDIVIGTALGFQPEFTLRGVSSDYKKIALFAQYLSTDRTSLSVSTAYARTYFHSALDREAASMLLNASLTSNLYVYANSEFDLRKKSGSEFVLSPRLTSLFVNLNYRITSSFSVGIGVDASRPYYSFQSVRAIPDSFLFDELRSGMSLNFNWMLAGGISFYNTYTPRNAANVSFGKDFSNYSSINIANVFSTGINVRSNFNVNANQYTNAMGYGAALQRTFDQLVDFTVRYQQNNYTIKQIDQRDKSYTVGADLMVFITNSLSFLATYDRLNGYGTISNSAFAEVSVRF